MKKALPLLWFFIFVLTGTAFPSGPDKEPILRIETGMHTAAINRVAIDDRDRVMVTGSYDKTIRVWEFPSGRLLRTIRPPIGEGDEGKIYAVAITGDGGTVAAGGWTGYEWDEYNSVYVFDTETGRMEKRIKKLPSNINHLVYSRDGKFLVAALGRDNGIRVLGVPGYSEVASDSEYGSDTYGVDFAPDGRLATVSYDGFIRLYDRDFQLVSKAKVAGGRQPYSVSFSPDGSKIAVGFNDSVIVAVLSGEDGRPLYYPEIAGVDNGDLSKVSWSSDGRYLYAGGRYAARGVNYILRWEGEGKPTAIEASKDTVMHILPLKDGGVLFCSSDPVFGAIDGNGNRIFYNRSMIADFRAGEKTFLASMDGRTVRFGYDEGGGSPARFSLGDRDLALDPPEDEALLPPVTEAPRLELTDWEYSHTPKLNGVPITLKYLEMSRSVAISHTADVFLIGTEWYLRLFDREGYDILEIPAPGATWAVNIPQSGRLALAAFGDGTIRWFNLESGEELLSFFPHRDKKRWVLWTASGYYDVPGGAEELFGWHKNQGKDEEAEFFPAGKYKEYNRPEVISKVLDFLSEEGAVAALKKSDKKESKWKVRQIPASSGGKKKKKTRRR